MGTSRVYKFEESFIEQSSTKNFLNKQAQKKRPDFTLASQSVEKPGLCIKRKPGLYHIGAKRGA